VAPKIVNQTERKKQIILAAIPIIASRGINQTRIEDIASAALIGKGTIYEYFSSKEDLFQGCFHHVMQEFFLLVDQQLPPSESPEEIIRSLFQNIGKQFHSLPPEYFFILSDIWMAASKATFLDQENPYDLNIYLRQFRNLIVDLIQRGISAGTFRKVNVHYYSVLAGAIFDGLVLHWILDKKSLDMMTALKEFSEMFLNSVRA